MSIPIGVFYTAGVSMLLGRMDVAAPEVGMHLTLPARGYHEREHCHKKPCRHGEPQREYRVTAVKLLDKKDGDTYDQVLSDRQWEQSVCTEHRNCDDFFDWYALGGYLGMHNNSPAHIALVDVEPI